MIRLLNICVIAALVAAAAYVYKIKFESTRAAERLTKVQIEIRRENDTIATLRAEYSKLDNPARIQLLAKRHLKLQPFDPHQFDRFDRLPARPPELVPTDTDDPIAFLIDKRDVSDVPTSSIPSSKAASVASPKAKR